jgi:hypothetical protein
LERFHAFFESQPRHIKEEFLAFVYAHFIADPSDRGASVPERRWTPELKRLKELLWGRCLAA